MLQLGLVEEVERLRRRPGLTLELPSMRAVGYRQVWQYLDGKLDYAEMLQCGVAATRQLAKRQMTWLRSEPGLHWLSPQPDRSGALPAGLESVLTEFASAQIAGDTGKSV